MADNAQNAPVLIPPPTSIPSQLAAVGSPTVPSPAWNAIAAGDVALLCEELDNGYNIEETDVMGRTLLIEAARFNQEQCVRELLKRGADPHHVCPTGTADSLTTNDIIYDLIQKAKLSSASATRVTQDGALESDIDSDDEEGLLDEPPTPGGSMDNSPQKQLGGGDVYRPPQRGAPAAPCIFFQKGFCRNGEACRFSHSIPIVAPGASMAGPSGHGTRMGREKREIRDTSMIPCKYFMMGACRYGAHCRFLHSTPYATPPEPQAYEYIPVQIPVENGFVYGNPDVPLMMAMAPPQPWQMMQQQQQQQQQQIYQPQGEEGYEEGEEPEEGMEEY